MYKIKRDKYQKARGGYSRILDITCEHCGQHVCYYQKDGPGGLRRMYVDRMIDTQPDGKLFACSNCQQELAIKIIWKKENRPAYRLFAEAVRKTVIRKTSID